MSGVRATRCEDGGLLEVVIDAPKGNVLTRAVMEALDGVFATHATIPDLRLITLRGEGADFSFGASVEEHRRPQVRAMLEVFHRLIRRVGACPVPVAAVVDGRCLGGAFELALACHLVLASPRAVFACPEIRLGVFPPVLAALGPARLGGALTDRLMLTGAELSATSPAAASFLADVAPPEADLGAWSREWYREHMARLSGFSLRRAVSAARVCSGFDVLLQRGVAEAERQYLNELMSGHDGDEGIEAFIGRRRPAWRHV